METDFIAAELNGRMCDVYFFRRWGGYSQPVVPSEPIYLEDALASEIYFRVWLCPSHGEHRFSRFAGIKNQRMEIDLNGDYATPEFPSVFQLRLEDGSPKLGPSFEIDQIDQYDRFIFHDGTESGKYYALSPVESMSYTYNYDEDGLLQTVFMKNSLGNERVLNMQEE